MRSFVASTSGWNWGVGMKCCPLLFFLGAPLHMFTIEKLFIKLVLLLILHSRQIMAWTAKRQNEYSTINFAWVCLKTLRKGYFSHFSSFCLLPTTTDHRPDICGFNVKFCSFFIHTDIDYWFDRKLVELYLKMYQTQWMLLSQSIFFLIDVLDKKE